MGKEQQKKKTLTLADIISKNKQKNKNFRGSHYLESYGGDIDFRKCEEEFFFDLMDKYPAVFDDKDNTFDSTIMEAMNRLLYECILVRTDDGLIPLKVKKVQDALGIDPTKPDKIIDSTVKALLPNFTDRAELFGAIIDFSGFGGDVKKKNIAEKTKN